MLALGGALAMCSFLTMEISPRLNLHKKNVERQHLDDYFLISYILPINCNIISNKPPRSTAIIFAQFCVLLSSFYKTKRQKDRFQFTTAEPCFQLLDFVNTDTLLLH